MNRRVGAITLCAVDLQEVSTRKSDQPTGGRDRIYPQVASTDSSNMGKVEKGHSEITVLLRYLIGRSYFVSRSST